MVTHSEMTLAITGHENRQIKIFDINSMKLIHQCTSHKDAVTSLLVKDFHLISGSHDGMIRIWDLRNMKVINETRAHQTKYDEGLLSID